MPAIAPAERVTEFGSAGGGVMDGVGTANVCDGFEVVSKLFVLLNDEEVVSVDLAGASRTVIVVGTPLGSTVVTVVGTLASFALRTVRRS